MPASTSLPEAPLPTKRIDEVQPQRPVKRVVATVSATEVSAVFEGRQQAPEDAPDALEVALLACLPKLGVARPTTDLREQVRRRKADVLDALRRLEARGRIERTRAGWRRREGLPNEPARRLPVPTPGENPGAAR